MTTASPQKLDEGDQGRVAEGPEAASRPAPSRRPVTPEWPNSWNWPPEPGEALDRYRLPLPDHTQLPESDGTFVTNFQEHPQALLLTDSILPVLRRRHSDGMFTIGQDSGIYWRLVEPPLRGVKAPDWFYVPGVPPLLEGRPRKSYVLWQEFLPPLILLEFVSGDGTEERDRTPQEGKFWVYENVIRPAYYGIYEVDPGRVEMYEHVAGKFQPQPANERGHYPIPQLGVELGIWQGSFQNMQLPWLRWWDEQGNLLLIGEERAEQERQRAE
ncbi:MAG TPA: Uma2 family endonuclease, partial [Isosphaeraceae bacterium]